MAVLCLWSAAEFTRWPGRGCSPVNPAAVAHWLSPVLSPHTPCHMARRHPPCACQSRVYFPHRCHTARAPGRGVHPFAGRTMTVRIGLPVPPTTARTSYVSSTMACSARARPASRRQPANKALHLTLANVAKMRDCSRVFRVVERGTRSSGAGELSRSATFCTLAYAHHTIMLFVLVRILIAFVMKRERTPVQERHTTRQEIRARIQPSRKDYLWSVINLSLVWCCC